MSKKKAPALKTKAKGKKSNVEVADPLTDPDSVGFLNPTITLGGVSPASPASRLPGKAADGGSKKKPGGNLVARTPFGFGKNSIADFEEANANVVALENSLADLGNQSTISRINTTPPAKVGLSLKPKREVQRLTRKELFDDVESPVNNLLDKLASCPKSVDLLLFFTGVEQLTDSVFGRLLEGINEMGTPSVIGVDLTGCKYLTDQGILWMGKCFPKLTKVKLSGCRNLTTQSLVSLTNQCRDLREVEAVLTGVTVIPRTLANLTLQIDGSPLISPAASQLTAAMESVKAGDAGLYKPLKTVRACIFPVGTSPPSLLPYLTKGTQQTRAEAPVFGYSEVKLPDGSACHVTECPEVACSWPMFLSERTVYILTYDVAQGDSGQITDSLTRLISLISAQVTSPYFIVAGTMSASTLTPALTEQLQLCENRLKKEIEAFSKTEQVKGTSYQSQHHQGAARQLLDRLQTTMSRVKTLELNTSNVKNTLLSLVVQIRDEDMKNSYPHYSEITSELLTAVSNLPKLLPKGVASEEAALKAIKSGKWPKTLSSDLQIKGALKLAHMLGLIVQVPSRTSAGYVVRPDQLTTFLNSLVSGPQGEKASPVGVPVAKGNKVQDPVLLEVAKELGVAVSKGDNLYMLYSLPEQPHIPMSHFWDAEKRSCDMQVAYTYSFPTSVSDTVLARIQSPMMEFNCSGVKVMWRNGVVLQDGVVDICIEKRGDKSGASSLLLKGRLLNPGVADVQKKAVQILWFSVEQWKLLVDGVLSQLQIFAKIDCQADTSKPDVVFPAMPLVTNHVMKSTNGKSRCQNCYIPADAAGFLKKLALSLYPVFVDKEVVKQSPEAGLDVEGLVWKGNQGQQGSVSIKSELNTRGDSDVSVVIIKGEKQDLSAMTLSYEVTLADGPSEIFYQAGKVVVDEQEVKALRQVILSPGDTVSLGVAEHVVNNTPSADKMMLTLSVNGEAVFTREEKFVPGIRCTLSWTQPPVNSKLILMVEPPKGLGSRGRGQIYPGMRLEARDRKNPLICVATIEQINDDGMILIHFDGWTDRYDYWAEPTSPDLHPLGYQAYIGYTHKQYNSELQKPKGYPKSFDWGIYLKEINCLPVPYEFFTEEQKEGTPPTEELRALDVADLSTAASTLMSNCTLLPNRTLCVEQRVYSMLADETSLQRLWTECNSMTKFPCLLPAEFDKQKLDVPTRRLVTDVKKQHVHFLCSGQGMESLHFVNSKGDAIDMELSDLISLATVIRFIFLVLSNQESFLPSNAVELCPGIDALTQRESEDKVIKVLFQYLLHLEMLSPWKSKSGKSGVDPTAANKLSQNLFKTALNANSGTLLNFPEASESENHLLRCHAHSIALSENQQLTEMPLDRFQGYSALVAKLFFQRNKITSISQALAQEFSFLSHLVLADNLIESCPENLFTLPCLELLDLSCNKITSLSPSIEKLVKTLLYLNISNNPLGKFPDAVLTLVHLEELRADNIGELTSLQGIDKLTKLRVLNISGNLMTQPLHDSFGKLPSLVELRMAGVPWFTGYDSHKSGMSFEAFGEFLNKNVVLSKLEKQKLFTQVDKAGTGHLDSTAIAELNNILFKKYPRFGDKTQAPTKTLKSCEGGLPTVLLGLTGLTTLDLSFHHLQSVPPELGKSLTSLHYLRLTDNPVLEALAAEVGNLPLKELHLKGCGQLKTPPKEVVNRGFAAVFGYLKRLAMGSVSCRRTKLMVVGLGGAGKTSLIEALTHRRFINENDFDDMYEIMGEAITDGIDITTWKVNVRPEEGKSKSEDASLEYSVWDFAGQTVYYNTHQFFLSTRAVYLLLWNIRLGYEHAGLDFWLSSIACHAPGAPVLVVGTHCDKVEKPKMPTDDLQKRFPQIRGFHSVSSYSLQGIPDLQNNLIEITLQEKYMGEQIPEAWLSMEGLLKQNTKQTELLPLSAVEKIGNTCGVFDHVELIQAVEFLHDLGSVQFFNTDLLRSYVVINPQWIVNVMKCVVSVHEGAIKEGKFYHGDMKTVWADYPDSMHDWLLQLTEEFDLTFPLHHEKANLVPCLLPDKEPKYNWPDVDRVKGHKETKMIYEFRYLPAGLFNRVQVRLHQFSDDAMIWKKGSLLKKNNHVAVILQTGVDEMLIKVQGPRPENILFLFHEVLECLISESFFGVHYDFSVPCNDCLEVFSLDPSMFHASKVQRAVELKAPFLQCERYFHTLSITELQAAMPADKNADLDIHLGKSVRELQDLHGDLVLKVYFSFCKDNVPAFVGDDKTVDPDSITAGLRQAGMKVTATEATGGEDLTKLTLTLKESDVVLVGMSDEFVLDKACTDLLYFARETLRKTVILVILGSGFTWQKSKIGILCATDVYVNMQQGNQFNTKMGELVCAVKQRSVKNKVTDYPSCFISYSWANSKKAIDLGSRGKDGSLGWGDPREVKDFLAKNGISCWMDVEQVGKGGLYEDIAEGLRQAKVMVACVSDEYAESKNCQMEFRYAVTTLKIPTILAVMGTGYQWERTEVGMLSVGYECPKVNFQYENLSAHDALLEQVRSLLPEQERSQGERQAEKDEQQVAFQEVLELTQRKFLRHVISYADSMDSTPYPRLIVLNFPQQPSGAATQAEQKVLKNSDKSSEGEQSKTKDNTADVEASKYCFTLLCEHEEGWHDASPSIPLSKMSAQEEESFLSDTAGYMARLFAILKHTNLTLASLTTQEGERLRSHLDGICAKKGPEFQEEYVKIRRMVMELDQEGIMGNLKKCHLLNGKTAWLCPKHQPAGQVSNPGGDNSGTSATDKRDNPIQPMDADDSKMSANLSASDEAEPEEKKQTETRPPLRALNKPANNDNSKVNQPVVTSRACSVM